MPSANLIRAIVLAVSVSLPVAAPARQVPFLMSDNLEVVAVIPDPGAIGGRILGDMMITTSASGLRIYDIAAGVPVLIGSTQLPTYQNEDIDTNGKIALLSSDFLVGAPLILTTVDITDPTAPKQLATIRVPEAHTASCILDCAFAWLGGGSGRVYVVDLRSPAAPVLMGSFAVTGLAHDVQVDDSGIAWVSSSGGLFAYSPVESTPLQPMLVGSSPNKSPGSFENDSLLHNSLIQGDRIFVVEEDWDPISNGRCARDGAFQTGKVTVNPDGTRSVERLARFSLGQGTVGSDRLPAAPLSCSAHYFDVRPDGLATVAWYEQGVRVLDVSNPPRSAKWDTRWALAKRFLSYRAGIFFIRSIQPKA